MFGSNWRTNISEDTSLDAYLVDLTNMLTGLPGESRVLAESDFQPCWKAYERIFC